MHYWRIIAAGLLMFLLGYRLFSATTSDGRLQIVERQHAFGDATDTARLRHVFVLANTGDDPLEIKDVHASCGCTVTELVKKTIPPGDTAQLHVTLSLKGKGKGPIKKTIWITTDSKSTPSDSLTITATVTALHAGTMMTVENIFTGDCRKCHVVKGVGKFEATLFQADCAMCHVRSADGHTTDMAGIMAKQIKKEELRKIIAGGKPNTNMPAFASAHGGPLTDEQIESLVKVLSSKLLGQK